MRLNIGWKLGLALAAWRDKQMMDWDHDLDFAIWFEACPDIDVWKNYFTDTQFELIVQRNLPYLDNIIQLKCKEAYKQDLIDIDIYLYKRMDGQAYMRWIHKPSGFGAPAKRYLFQVLFSLFKPLHAGGKNGRSSSLIRSGIWPFGVIFICM